MPADNRFRHQQYCTGPPARPWFLVTPGDLPPLGSDEFRTRMNDAGRAIAEAGVAAILLAHGTFVGSDALGILAGFERFVPGAGGSLRRSLKRLIDAVAGEAGNYTEDSARTLEEALFPAGGGIPVRRFHWSSENHHIGRADGAVRLLYEMQQLELPRQGRVLLLGHSHAGNVFALVSNLLGGDPQTIEQFFAAARAYYHWPLAGHSDLTHWKGVHEALSADAAVPGSALDVVTFGTPVRYGWDSGGYGRLLHFVNHRPAAGLPAYAAAFPFDWEDVAAAAHGDYIQQIGIAGTNTAPNVISFRALLADRRLNHLLQQNVRARDLLKNLRAGVRVPDEGTTLLVDYGRPEGNVAQHLAGHAVYTRQKWMLFHVEEIVRRLYG